MGRRRRTTSSAFRRPLLSPSRSTELAVSCRRAVQRILLACLMTPVLAWAVEPGLWLDGGRLRPQARVAVDMLATADAHGLVPQDYNAAALRAAFAQASTPGADTVLLVDFDQRLTTAMQRYLSDLHGGRVDPRSIHERYDVASGVAFDAAAYLREAVASNRLAEAVRAAEPALPTYRQLQAALGRYRALDAGAWQTPLPPVAGNKLAPGGTYAGLEGLTARLVTLGDLPHGTPVPARYEGVLVDGVKSFQERHGLEQDGVLGKRTLDQLNVPPARRARQIELALERLRWLPLLHGPRMIVVNVPEFVLRAYEIRDGQIDVKATMRVIVGKALDTRTPLFEEDMRFIEFSPYWNIPPSIARAETVPKLRRSPAYFEQQGLEFVTGTGQVIRTLSEANLDAVLRGQMRIRQRPGPKNALGDIKFVFPNNENIYLHHTPSPQLFKRDRRDFSHGCVRVEEPVALAKFVLQNAPEWNEARIRAAMEKGASSTIRLQEPVPVVIVYGTSLVKNGGRLYFFDDLYGHDKLLDAALKRPRRTPTVGAAGQGRVPVSIREGAPA
ncbi:L,D-transpeptidase family protein [Imbroritus primus]|uniref:L,D-transpeptidase family protein n=1 Tax=Imbroritus primus TaxID=3058603 RepID=UPI003D160978